MSRVRDPYARFWERDKDGMSKYYPIFTLLDFVHFSAKISIFAA